MLKNYLKTAFKVFMRRKFFTCASLFGISFTLMVLMVFTAIFDHIFGPFPPEVKTERMVGIFVLHGDAFVSEENRSSWTGSPSYAFLDRYVRTLPDVERVSLSTFFGWDFSGVAFKNGEKIESTLKYTDGEFWQILDFEFLAGGPFTVEDEHNANFVAVINEATRKKYFGYESAIGKTIAINDQGYRVVGVVANLPIFRPTPFADIWLPISTLKTKEDPRALQGWFQALILAKKPEDIPLIKEEFHSRLGQVEFPDPKATNKLSGGVETFFESTSRQLLSSDLGESRPGLLLAILIGLMVLFMTLPTLNLINLSMSRILERSSEIGVRKAFGASSWTIVGQFVVESILLTSIGGVIGFVLASFALQVLSESDLLQYAQFHLNYRIFFYGLGTTLFFSLFSGVYPAWKMSRLHPVQALKGVAR